MLEIKRREDITAYCEENNIPEGMFNEPVTIDPTVTDCSRMFHGLSNFNQLVMIPTFATDCSHMFEGCSAFNQPVVIPYGVKNCEAMFCSMWKFNQSVVIPSTVENCNSMFNSCREFNQEITIPDSVKTCNKMFANCDKFNQPIHLPCSINPDECKDIIDDSMSYVNNVYDYNGNIVIAGSYMHSKLQEELRQTQERITSSDYTFTPNHKQSTSEYENTYPSIGDSSNHLKDAHTEVKNSTVVEENPSTTLYNAISSIMSTADSNNMHTSSKSIKALVDNFLTDTLSNSDVFDNTDLF